MANTQKTNPNAPNYVKPENPKSPDNKINPDTNKPYTQDEKDQYNRDNR